MRGLVEAKAKRESTGEYGRPGEYGSAGGVEHIRRWESESGIDHAVWKMLDEEGLVEDRCLSYLIDNLAALRALVKIAKRFGASAVYSPAFRRLLVMNASRPNGPRREGRKREGELERMRLSLGRLLLNGGRTPASLAGAPELAHLADVKPGRPRGGGRGESAQKLLGEIDKIKTTMHLTTTQAARYRLGLGEGPLTAANRKKLSNLLRNYYRAKNRTTNNPA
jgi:hypothetical protein